MKIVTRFALLLFAFAIHASEYAQAQLGAEKIVDQLTPVPGEGFDFGGLNSCIRDGDDVVFSASGMDLNGDSYSGIYRWSAGTISTIMDSSFVSPGDEGLSDPTFDFVGSVVDNFDGSYLFSGRNSNGTNALYSVDNSGTISRETPAGHSRIYSRYNRNTDGTITFRGGDDLISPQGYYVTDGTIRTPIVDVSTSIPGGTGTFLEDSFLTTFNDQGTIAFRGLGTGGQEGLYTNRNGSIEKVYDLNDVRPGSSQNFIGFFDPFVNGSDIAFLSGVASNDFGFYKVDQNGAFEILVDTSTIAPGSTNGFSSLANLQFEGDSGVFMGIADPTETLFSLYGYTEGNQFSELLAPGDILDGKEILFLSAPRDFDGESFFMNVRFTDNVLAAYRFTLPSAVPEPGSAALVLFALAAIGARRKR